DALRSELVALSRAIHGTPELAYQERSAVKNIAALLQRHGHSVEQKLGGVETAFRTQVGPPGPAVALLAEYDALPEIGHARGRNALSAAIRLFVAIDGWRQHLPADTRVHGIITKGGAAQNIIPELAECDIGLRAATVETLGEMQRTFAQMVQGAAMQTGTTAEIVDDMRLYAPVRPNTRVGDLLADELKRRGLHMVRGKFVLASTDFGNVSHVAPADYIGFPVSERSIPGHSHVMRESSATDLAHHNAMITAEILAAAAVRIATDAGL